MTHRFYPDNTMESIARNVIKTFNPTLLWTPTAVPIEDIMETKYKLDIVYQNIRKNGRVLGETAFDDTHVPVYDREDGRYLWIPVKRGTVIIEARLLNMRSEGRLRFTLAHELAHWIIHQYIYEGTWQTAAMMKSPLTAKSSQVDSAVERQADRLGSLLLMPAGQVKMAFYRNYAAQDVTGTLAKIFEVSKQAMDIRLKEMGLT